MRFLIVSNRPPDPNSGAAGTIWQTNVALRESGHEVDALWVDDLGRRRIQHGNLHSLIEQPRLYAKAVLKAVKHRDYDVVMISQPQGWLAAKKLKAAGFKGVVINRSHGHEIMADRAILDACRRLGTPVGRFPFRWFSPLMRRALNRQWQLAISYFDGFVVPSEDIKGFMIAEQAVAAERIAVVHHGVSAAFLTRPVEPMNSERLKRVLHISQFAFFKAPDIVARAFSEIAKNYQDIQFTWVCSSKDHCSARNLLDRRIAGRVDFVDWQNQEGLVDIFDRHGVFVFPSYYEGAGKVSLEAMSRGNCVISTKVGAMRDHIEDKTTGYLVDPGDCYGVTNGVGDARRNLKLSSEMAERAVVHARQFTWSQCAAGIVSAVGNWLGER